MADLHSFLGGGGTPYNQLRRIADEIGDAGEPGSGDSSLANLDDVAIVEAPANPTLGSVLIADGQGGWITDGGIMYRDLSSNAKAEIDQRVQDGIA